MEHWQRSGNPRHPGLEKTSSSFKRYLGRPITHPELRSCSISALAAAHVTTAIDIVRCHLEAAPHLLCQTERISLPSLCWMTTSTKAVYLLEIVPTAYLYAF